MSKFEKADEADYHEAWARMVEACEIEELEKLSRFVGKNLMEEEVWQGTLTSSERL